jgi:hypothetical protein
VSHVESEGDEVAMFYVRFGKAAYGRALKVRTRRQGLSGCARVLAVVRPAACSPEFAPESCPTAFVYAWRSKMGQALADWCVSFGWRHG